MTKAIYELAAEVRTDIGKGASRRLRRTDKIPAVIYGAHTEAQSITLDHKQIIRALENEGFYSHILTLHIDGKPEKAILKDMQRHPFKPKIQHMDFQRVDPKEKITVHVPLHIIGENVAPGVKAGGVVAKQFADIEISCLPGDLPEYIEADISNLNVGETLHLTDLKLPQNTEIVALTHGEDHDLPVVSIILSRASAAEETEEAAAAAPQAEKPTKQ